MDNFVSNPTSNDSSVTDTSNATAPSQQPPSSALATQPATTQPQSGQSQPAQSQMVTNPSPPAQDPNANHPAVQRAGLLRTVAETLAGGPRYTVRIDDSGNRVHTRVPLSRTDIGMAIALSAVSGALAGAGARGPNSNAEAAQRGFNTVAAQRQQADKQNEEQATQDFARRAAVAESNMHMLNNAVQVGRLQRENHDQMVSAYADVLQDWKDNAPELVKGERVPEAEAKDLNKWHMADYIRIPDGTVPRIGPDGRQVFTDAASGRIVPEGTPGAIPQWDNTYSMLDKSSKLSLKGSDGQPAQWVKDAVSWALPGYPPALLRAASIDVPATAAVRGQHQIVMLNTLQSELDSFAKSFGTNKDGSPKVAPTDLKAAVQNDPTLLKAVQQFQRSAGMSTQPDRQIDAMRSDPKQAPFAGQIIRLFGPERLEDFKSNREAREAGEKAKAEAEGRLPSELKLKDAERQNKQAEEQPLIESAAKSLANGDFTSLKDIVSMRGDERLKVYDRAKQINPNFNTHDIDVKVKTQEAFATGKQGDQIQSFGTFLQHAGDAAEASASYRRTGSPLLNKPLNWLAKNAENDQTYQSFITALQPVRDEYMTFLQDNHALTESDKKAADTIMSGNSTPAQIESALKMMGKTAFVRLGELNNRYKRVFGVDYPDLLSDDAKGAAGTLGLGNDAARYQTGGRVTGGASGSIPGKAGAQRVVPAGAIPGRDANGNIIGYKTADGKVVQF